MARRLVAGKVPKRVSWVWYEMARRYRQFHNGENWQEIHLWGLFYRSDIKSQLENGDLIPNSHYAKGAPMWVRPSEKAYKTKIRPLLDAFPLNILEKRAGISY